MGVAAPADEAEGGSSEGSGGVLILPCISRMARPEGVCRKLGRGLGV